MTKQTCSFTGHRPEKLPWGFDEADPRCTALKIMMEQQLRRLCDAGVHRYFCGMAQGTDRYFLEILIRLKAEYPLTLEAAIPCPSQPNAWSREERERYYILLEECDRIHQLSDHYYPGCMQHRNRFMVEHSDILMTVYDGTPGGTATTVAYAKARGLKIISLWR